MGYLRYDALGQIIFSDPSQESGTGYPVAASRKLLIGIGIVSGLLMLWGGLQTPSSSPSGLVAHYAFNNVAGTITPTHGTGPTFPFPAGVDLRDGVSGSAISLNGSALTSQAPPVQRTTGEITISLWVEPMTGLTIDRPTELPVVFRQNQDGAVIFLSGGLSGHPVRMALTTQPNASGVPIDGRVGLGTPFRTLEDGDWSHIVGVYGDGGMRLYLDGQLVGWRTNDSIGNLSPATPWRIGGWQFRGGIDELRIYSRALTAEDVDWLYHHDRQQ